MSRRIRQLAVAILLISVTLLAVGCGLGGGGSSATTALTIPSGATPSVTTSGTVTPQMQLVRDQKKLVATKFTPTDVSDALKAGRPVVLLFYVAGSSDDAQVLASLQKLQPEFSSYTFGIYDYKTPSAYGDLSTMLQVNYPPELILIDGKGTIKEIWNGFVDEGTMNQSLVNLGKA